MLEARGVSVRRGEREVVRGVSLSVAGGEVAGLIGPNGSGKSTLLSALAGLRRLAGGEVLLEGRGVGGMPVAERARRLAYLPQNPECHWPLDTAQVVALGRLPHRSGWGDGYTPRDDAVVQNAMRQLEVASLAARPVNRLSGGERMRVMLARAFAVEPAVLLADEPVDGLDPYHQLHVMELLRERAAAGCAVLVVLHELALAGRFCDRLLLLRDGRILADGAPDAVLTEGLCARAYGVETAALERDGARALVPWRRL
ncbi:MAG: ABC transporter ATP-binding protein [Opitutaceae bacterium]|nr:ABC transporter ATP-binding protein [Opitutaceae bacterium]